MTKDTKKETKTAITSILNAIEMHEYKQSQANWQTLLDTDKVRYGYHVNCAKTLLTIEANGKAKKLQSKDIANLIDNAFIGINKQQKSNLRFLGNNLDKINAYRENLAPNVHNVNLIINGYRAMVREPKKVIDLPDKVINRTTGKVIDNSSKVGSDTGTIDDGSGIAPVVIKTGNDPNAVTAPATFADHAKNLTMVLKGIDNAFDSFDHAEKKQMITALINEAEILEAKMVIRKVA